MQRLVDLVCCWDLRDKCIKYFRITHGNTFVLRAKEKLYNIEMKIILNCFIDGAFMNGFVLFLSCILFISFFKEIVRHFWHLCFVVYVSIITFDSIIYRWGIECLIGENYIRFDYKKEENNTIRLNQCRF